MEIQQFEEELTKHYADMDPTFNLTWVLIWIH